MRKALSYLVAIFLLGFLFTQVKNNWPMVSTVQFNFRPGDIATLIFLNLLVFPLNAFSWHMITRALGSKISFHENFKLWMYSNATRFLPGSVWQYMGRVYLFSKAGESKLLATTALLIESLLNILVAMVAVGLVVLFWGRSVVEGVSFGQNSLWIILFSCIILVIPFVVLGQKKLLNKVLLLLQKVSKRKLAVEHVNLPLRSLPILVGIFFLHFFLAGTILFLLARGISPLPFSLLPVFAGIYGAAFFLGYVAFFIPSGLGIQEASLAGLMSFYMPLPLAVIVSVLFRLVLLLSELLTLAPVWLVKKK